MWCITLRNTSHSHLICIFLPSFFPSYLLPSFLSLPYPFFLPSCLLYSFFSPFFLNSSSLPFFVLSLHISIPFLILKFFSSLVSLHHFSPLLSPVSSTLIISFTIIHTFCLYNLITSTSSLTCTFLSIPSHTQECHALEPLIDLHLSPTGVVSLKDTASVHVAVNHLMSLNLSSVRTPQYSRV